MTKRILILALLLAVAGVWWRVLNPEKPVKLNQAEQRESLGRYMKGKR